jgi:Transposase DDE domain
LAEAGLSLAEVYEGHGLLGKGESGDREGVERDRPAAVRAITGREAGVKEGLIVFKENKVEVRERLKDGRIDYLDLTSWSFQDRLFGFLIEERFFEWCGSSYPTPRQRENIPVWFLLACGIQMKLHRSAAFQRLTYILRSGSILTRVRFNVGLKGGGFNEKNKKSREIPIDQDSARKFFTDTGASGVEHWYNTDVQKWLRRHRGYSDKEGIFILDPTLIVLPDNPNYRKAALLPLDQEGRYVDVQKLSPQERKRFKYTRAYKLTMLLHWSRQDDYFMFAGGHLGKGDESGLKRGEELVDQFVSEVGKGVIKLLIMDREFIDGPMITRFKKSYGIDCLVPLKSNMHALLDALGISKIEGVKWLVYDEVKDEAGRVVEVEEVAGVGRVESWESCEVPLYIILVRARKADGHNEIWALASTKESEDPRLARELYKGRMQIEERIDQIKNCWWVGCFTTPNFNADVVHVFFVLLTYTLIQLYLKASHHEELATKTIETLKQEERLGKDAVIVYAEKYFAVFDLDEYTDIILYLKTAARDRMRRWIKRFRRNKIRAP